jgi:hypothetical protein
MLAAFSKGSDLEELAAQLDAAERNLRILPATTSSFKRLAIEPTIRSRYSKPRYGE